jgi:hypothetical protein
MNATSVLGCPDPQAIANIGRRIYANRYQTEFEARYPGQIVAIDISSERAFVASSVEEAVDRGHGANPTSLFHVIKVGAPAVYRMR